MATSQDDAGVIDLRSDQGEADFKLDRIEDPDPVERSSETVRVKFSKFVSLVANHDYEEILHKYKGEEVIMKADLLADLANIPQEKDDRKIPTIFILGLILGVIVTWILIKT